MKQLFVILICCLSIFSFSQKHEWVTSFDGYRYAQIVSQQNDDKGNTYVAGGFGDSVISNNQTLKDTVSAASPVFYGKLDDKGNVQWLKKVTTLANKNGYGDILFLNEVLIQAENKIYFFGTFSGPTLIVAENDSLKGNIDPEQRTGFVICVDSSGNTLFTKKIIEGYGLGIGTNLTIDNQNDIYLNISILRNCKILSNEKQVSLNYGNGRAKYLIIKYSSEFDSIIWYKEFPDMPKIQIRRLRMGDDGNLYLAANTRGGSFKLAGINYTFPSHYSKGFLIILDKNGHFIRADLINKDTSQQDVLFDVAAKDTNHIWLTGAVEDSIMYYKKWYKPKNTNSSGFTFSYMGMFKKVGEPQWLNFTKEKDTKYNWDMFNHISRLNGFLSVDSMGFLYSYCTYRNNTVAIGGLSNNNDCAHFFAKTDLKGNTLWLNVDNDNGINMKTLFSFSLVNTGELHYGGSYNGNVFFDPFNIQHYGTPGGNSGFVAKIMDYSITRGDVSYGPFCAGDTFLVPYTQTGKYDSANYFIAELSDAEGNFEDTAKVRELGRLKATTDSTIVGQLPLFQVASSQKYRIRVRSTHPPVQSYYRLDTLRLLIYSRDSANPGPPEAICKGDTFQLNTFGGTAWHWSPADSMDDNNLRQPLVWPDTTTEYQIIISDSSGCGQADTAVKRIVVKKSPTASFASQDTTVCANTRVNVVGHFSGGDTAHYQWDWFAIDEYWSYVRSGSNDSFHSNYRGGIRLNDTLQFQLPPQEEDSQQLALVIRDHCSPRIDTAYFNIKVNTVQPQISLQPQDSAICPGTAINIYSQFKEGDNTNYSWSWQEEANSIKDGSQQQKDTLSITPDFSSKEEAVYTLILTDNCSPKQDTAQVKVYPRAPLQITTTPKDTLLCKGQAAQFVATATGGVQENYSWQWKDEKGTIVSTHDTLQTIADTTQTFYVILSDGCMPNSDTAKVTLTVNPPLEGKILKQGGIEAKDTTICFGNTLKFYAEGEGGDPSGYSFSWWFKGQEVGTDRDIELTFDQEDNTTQTLTLVLKDNCTEREDTLPLQIDIRPKLEVSANLPDTLCRGEELTLITHPTGGLPGYSYEWIWEGQQVSTDSSSLQVLEAPNGESGTLQLILSDGCTQPNDTFTQEIYFRPELGLKLSTLDSCANPDAVITATPTGGLSSTYQINWEDEDGNALGTDQTINVTPTGTQTYFATLTDGCSDTSITDSITIDQQPKMEMGVSPTEGCEPLEVNFAIRTKYPDPFNWTLNFDNGKEQTHSHSDTHSVISYQAGGYSPTATLTTDYGCKVEWTGGTITVYPKPTAFFEYNPENPTLDNPTVNFINLSTGAETYHWTFGSTGTSTAFEPQQFFGDSGTYPIQLIATSTKGCIDSFSSELTVTPTYFVYVPNAFSPNGDGVNDEFKPVFSGVKDLSYKIYNRWGELVFEGQKGDAWNGYYKNRLVPAGVYVYVVPVTKKAGGQETVRGTVNVLR